ncbi:hypothetical protein A2W24_01895 [Microgenomates group bacterium RBG_16_45_19]|nr:MAG: hypothetical protein A2W24_01895 [Microgenomates group bacterium RBG_16_45_19]
MQYNPNGQRLMAHICLAIILGVSLANPPEILAGGLRCSVGEVVVENLKIGNTYSLKTLANLPLSITNTGSEPVTVRVEPVVPASTETKQGAEPLPAPSWAKAVPDSFELYPQESKSVEMILTIPEEEAYFGRKFQVNFWSHTLPKANQFLAYGLSSRVIFTIDRVREDPNSRPTGDLSFSIIPGEVKLRNPSPGVVYQLEKLLDRPLVIRNTSSKKLMVELKLLGLQESVAYAPEGYSDLWASADVNLSPSILYLEPGEEKQISGTIRFDKKAKFSNKNYLGIICAAVTDQEVKTRIYSRIYADFK